MELSRGVRVFLCHSSNDKSDVRALCQRLRKQGIDPWLGEERILPGQDWDAEIRKAVRTADAKASITAVDFRTPPGALIRRNTRR